MIMPGSTVATPIPQNKNLYNGGSEWQNDYNNNMPGYYETFYRNYDAAIGRFIAVDPKAEGAEGMTPFQYAANNPIMGNDPMGDLLRMLDEPPPPPTADKPAVSGANNWLENSGAYTGEGNGGGGSLPDGRAQQINILADMAAWESDNSFAEAWNQLGTPLYRAAGPNGGGLGSLNHVMGILYNNAHAYGQALLNNIYSGLNYHPTNIYVSLVSGFWTDENTDANQGGKIFKSPNGRFIVNIEKTEFSKDDDNTILYGVKFTVLFYQNNNKYKAYQWLQTITDCVNGDCNQQIDGENLPFYMTSKRESDYADAYGVSAYTEDSPASNASTRDFTAETTLLGQDNNGKWSAIGTVYWGYFSILHDAYPESIFFSNTPSFWQQSIITNKINSGH